MFIGYFLLVLFDLHDEKHLHFWESFLQPHIRSNLCLPGKNRKPLMAISNYTFQRGVREKEINFKVLCANQNVTLNGLKLSKGDFKIDQKTSFNKSFLSKN